MKSNCSTVNLLSSSYLSHGHLNTSSSVHLSDTSVSYEKSPPLDPKPSLEDQKVCDPVIPSSSTPVTKPSSLPSTQGSEMRKLDDVSSYPFDNRDVISKICPPDFTNPVTSSLYMPYQTRSIPQMRSNPYPQKSNGGPPNKGDNEQKLLRMSQRHAGPRENPYVSGKMASNAPPTKYVNHVHMDMNGRPLPDAGLRPFTKMLDSRPSKVQEIQPSSISNVDSSQDSKSAIDFDKVISKVSRKLSDFLLQRDQEISKDPEINLTEVIEESACQLDDEIKYALPNELVENDLNQKQQQQVMSDVVSGLMEHDPLELLEPDEFDFFEELEAHFVAISVIPATMSPIKVLEATHSHPSLTFTFIPNPNYDGDADFDSERYVQVTTLKGPELDSCLLDSDKNYDVCGIDKILGLIQDEKIVLVSFISNGLQGSINQP